ncbi:MAG: hypothetical protein ABH836_05065 [Candidatus Omnitrophota bacterium]
MTLKPADISEEEFEAVCKHCGVCCGSTDGDPCIYLEQKENGNYYCRIYTERLGNRITVKGNVFRCIPIEQAIKYPHIQEICGYAKFLKK